MKISDEQGPTWYTDTDIETERDAARAAADKREAALRELLAWAEDVLTYEIPVASPRFDGGRAAIAAARAVVGE